MVAEMSARNQQSLWQSVVGIAIGFGILIGAVLAHPKVSTFLTFQYLLILIKIFL